MNFKSKKGSVAVYALLSLGILIALLFSIYLVVNARYRSQLKTATNIKIEAEEYNIENDVEIIDDAVEIYLYEPWQLEKMGTNEYVYIAQENKIYKFTNTAKYLNKYMKVNIGDTILYDPTIGAQSSQLTYTSPVGSALGTNNISGNGHTEQTFTATSVDNEWIVIGKANDRLKLISKDPKFNTNNTPFYFGGGRAWLYMEEQLHRAASIYGYGNGADKSQVTTYQIGNPEIAGEVQNKILTGSGARSLILDDIQEMTTRELIIPKSTANTNNPTSEVYVPSLNGTTTAGQCQTTDMKKNLPYTWKQTMVDEFKFKDKYRNLDKSIIFTISRTNMIATRCTAATASQGNFYTYYTNSSSLSGQQNCYGNSSALNSNGMARGLRPIVYLEPTVQLNETATPGRWQLVQN